MIFENSRELSLVEQKKLQWAKERDELERMGGGGELFSHSQTKYEKTSVKTFYSNVDVPNRSRFNPQQHSPDHPTQFHHFQEPAQPKYFFQNQPTSRHIRSPSLPPIEKANFHAQNQPQYPQQLTLNDIDTGYNSENSPPHATADVWTNEDHLHVRSHPPHTMSNQKLLMKATPINCPRNDGEISEISRYRQNSQDLQLNYSQEPHIMKRELPPDAIHIDKPPSSSSSGHSFSTMSQSFQDGPAGYTGRRKWGDRNVNLANHHYDPMARSVDSRSSRNVPIWLEKGMSEIRDSEDESVRSFIRGQNTPIDPNTLAERANRRRKAMELQNEIKEQLMERERVKKWEKEKRLREERLEEERLMQQIEAERLRFEYERKRQDEKMESERKKQELMRLALEKAEQEARFEKDKRKKMAHQSRDDPVASNIHEKEKIQDRTNNDSQEEMVEKVLIGTPIKLKKRVPNNNTAICVSMEQEIAQPIEDSIIIQPAKYSENPVNKATHLIVNGSQQILHQKSTDIDGIALVIQSISPVVPLGINNDFLGLNQSVNNLQFAILLAQQQQQLNQQAQHLNSVSSSTSSVISGIQDSRIKSPLLQVNTTVANQDKSDLNEQEVKECIYCCKIHGHKNGHGVNSAEIHRIKDEKSNQVEENLEDGTWNLVPDKQTAIRSASSRENNLGNEAIKGNSTDLKEVSIPKLPHDGTFIKDNPAELKIETSTGTSTDVTELEEKPFVEQRVRILTPRKYRNAQSGPNEKTVDVAVQTDLQLLQNCNICVHQHLVLKEISRVTTSVTQTSRGNRKDLSPINLSKSLEDNNDSTTTTTVTTTTMIRAKSKDPKKSCYKKEPRPKWGVNRPSIQYVKASERDPFCLRNRRKKTQQRFVMSESEQRDKIDSGISDISSDSLADFEDNREKKHESDEQVSSRKVYTEILPIKTDGNGHIFLNFQEASAIVAEADQRQRSAKMRYREKIMDRRCEDLPVIPAIFRTEKKLSKSKSHDQINHFLSIDQSKWEKNELNALTKNNQHEAMKEEVF